MMYPDLECKVAHPAEGQSRVVQHLVWTPRNSSGGCHSGTMVQDVLEAVAGQVARLDPDADGKGPLAAVVNIVQQHRRLQVLHNQRHNATMKMYDV